MTTWTDAHKVLVCSLLTLPFAVGWLIRLLQLQSNTSLSPYVDRDFLPQYLPFLWVQAIGHLVLVLGAYALHLRKIEKSPWLVQIEIHFWAVCLSISLYTVSSFTTPFSILLVGLPVFGYLLFGAAIKSGLIAMAIGTATGMVLPQLGMLPYAPFLKTAPCADGQLHPAWIGAFGMPAIFVAVIVVAMQISLMRQLHEQQRELEHLSGTDVLTGLANRAAFFERLAAELARARRHGQCISMLRADDVAGRYGGEEFAMILPHTTLQQAVIVSERIRVGVHAIHIGTPTDSRAALPLSVSIGLAQHDGSETADQLVARADVALYRAKHAGRDQVAVAGTAVTVDAIDSAAS